VTDRRLTTLRAALGFLQIPPRAPDLRLLYRWLDSWAGLGLIVVGIRRLGYESEFRQYPQGWRVNVRRASVDPIIASGWAPTPWEAVQSAAWAAVKRAPSFPTTGASCT